MPRTTRVPVELRPTTKVSTHVDHVVADRLAAIAADEGLSVAAVVRRAILRDVARTNAEAQAARRCSQTVRRRGRYVAGMAHVNLLWRLLPGPAQAVVWLVPLWLTQGLSDHPLELVLTIR